MSKGMTKAFKLINRKLPLKKLIKPNEFKAVLSQNK